MRPEYFAASSRLGACAACKYKGLRMIARGPVSASPLKLQLMIQPHGRVAEGGKSRRTRQILQADYFLIGVSLIVLNPE